MPRMKKWTGNNNMSVCPTMSVTTQSMLEQCRKKSCSHGRTNKQYGKKSHKLFPRRDILYHQHYHEVEKYQSHANPPGAHCQFVANSCYNSDSEGDIEEVDNTPLTKANIPTIVDTGLSNFSTEGTSSKDDSQDISYPSEQASQSNELVGQLSQEFATIHQKFTIIIYSILSTHYFVMVYAADNL